MAWARSRGTVNLARHYVHEGERSPWQRAALAAGLGIGAAAAQLAAFWERPQPKTAKSEAETEEALAG